MADETQDPAEDQAQEKKPEAAPDDPGKRALETKIARLEGAVDALKSAPPAPKQEQKTYTRAELRALVAEKRITEDQMDETLERQAEARLAAATEARIADVRASAKIEAEIERFVDSYPDLKIEGSETREKVQAEFNRLVARGLPSTLATELTAIEAALGSQRNTIKGRKKAPETHEETGGGRADDRSGGDAGWSKGLNARQKGYYEGMINKGIYKSANDPKLKAELDLVRKRSAH